MKELIKDYTERLEQYVEQLENGNYDVETDVLELEQEIQQMASEEPETQGFRALLKSIQKIKKEYDFYDEEATLDMMFPDRHYDDFDEDSMSWDSVFGDD